MHFPLTQHNITSQLYSQNPPHHKKANRHPQLISLISLFSATNWTNSKWLRPVKRLANRNNNNNEEDNRAHTRRLIEESVAGEPYRDDPEEPESAPAASNGTQSSRVEPSALGGHNEWRDEEHGRSG